MRPGLSATWAVAGALVLIATVLFLGSHLEGGGSHHPVAVSGVVQPHARVTFQGKTDGGTQLARTVRADGRGHFSVILPPGTYNAVLSGAAWRKVKVEAGHPVRLTVP